MRHAIVLAFLLIGCSESATELTAWQKAMRDGSTELVAKHDETLSILKDNTAALTAIKTKVQSIEGSILETRRTVGTLEASLVKSEPEPGKEVIKSAPESPARANTTAIPLKVATPGTSFRTASDGTVLRWNIAGNWNPTILETSAHLRQEHGIDTNGMTHQEMADIHAALHEGKPMPVRSTQVQSFVTRSSCPDGVCPVPQRVSRKRR